MKTNASRSLAVTGILLGMSVLAVGWSSINMSLASIQTDLPASMFQVQWMMNAYGIFICIPLLAVGKLGDAYGRKKFYMAGLAGLGAACLGGALAPSPGWLIASMGLFGVSGASVLTLSQALTVHQFPESQKGRAIAIWATFTSVALAAGPLVGGTILSFLDWRWIFWLEVPISLIALLLVASFVKKEELRSVECGWGGVALFALIIGSLVAGIMQGPNWGWGSWKVISLFALSAIASWGFIAVERKSEKPLFRPDLFSHPNFLFASICNGCLIGFIWSLFFFLPIFLQNERGISSFETGATMLLITLPVAFLSVSVNKLYEKVGAKPLLAAGYFLLAVSVILQMRIPIQASCLLMGFGWVLTWGPSAARALSTLPHRMAGMASGMFMTMQEIGGVIGLAASGVVFRMGSGRKLASRMEEIESLFGERTQALLSNPKAAAALAPDSPILAWLQEAFRAGYSDMLWWVAALMLAALGCSLLLPKAE